ncbi:IS21 family transposase [Brevundimonas aurantiaca]|uniref:IS21 family transposase n=1 Tax=Brevundimonas aurantiaca TaxID=74316 RepID=UPI002FDE0DBF
MFDPRGLLRLILTSAHSDRQIGRMIGCSYSTVARYRLIAHKLSLTGETLCDLADSDLSRLFNPGRSAPRATGQLQPNWAAVALKVKAGHHLKELHDAYSEAAGDQPTMSYRDYCRKFRDYDVAAHPIMRQRHRPGETMMVDFAGFRPRGRDDDPAHLVPFELFVAVLPSSDYTFACVTRSQRTVDWIWANEQALRFFGGVPQVIISDNLKAAVVSHRRGQTAVINPTFQAFCDHHGTIARPAKAYSPTHKAKVEIGVKLIQRLLRLALTDRPAMSLGEMNALLGGLLGRLNAKGLRRAPGQSRVTLFEQLDRPALRPLQMEPFAFFEVRRQLLLGPDYHILHDQRRYSAPHTLIGRRVDVRANASTIEIWHDGKTVGVHPRVATIGDASTDPSRMPPNHLARRAAEDEDLVMWSRLHGPGVQAVVQVEAGRPFVGAVKTSIYRSFRDLARRVGPVRLEAACARALRIGEPRLAHVRKILDRNLEFTDPADFVAPKTAAAMNENVRGPEYFKGA